VWALVVFAAATLFVSAWPTRESSSSTCVVCASRRSDASVTSLFGLLRWDDDPRIEESAVIEDGLLGRDHRHEWKLLWGQSHGLLKHAIRHGGWPARPFAEEYAYDLEFRAEARAALADGRITHEQIQREIEGSLPNFDPDRAGIEELLDRIDRTPRYIR
jgi:hypothetical protein